MRIVCATHQNLQERIADATFREDLFYRLAEIVITVPPLRDRSGDARCLLPTRCPDVLRTISGAVTLLLRPMHSMQSRITAGPVTCVN